MDDNTHGTQERAQRQPFWTFDLGISELVQPYANPKAFAAYRAVSDDGKSSAEGRDTDLLHFAGLGATEAATLLNVLDDKELSHRQNFSPTLRAFLQSAVDHPRDVELFGYVIGPQRADERISVEGVLLFAHDDLVIERPDPYGDGSKHSAECQCRALWRLAQDEYGLADAECFPDEIGPFRAVWRPAEHCWRLWWD